MTFENQKKDLLAQLSVADPDLAEKVISGLKQKSCPISDKSIAMLVDETLWGLSQEISFGQAIAMGYVDLIGETSSKRIKKYRDLLHDAGIKGPTLGRIMATYLVPVLINGDDRFLACFLQSVEIMLNKGTYTLKDPLRALASLLNERDLESASAYLDLLCDTFSQDFSYAQCQHFAYILPRSVRSFSSNRRVWQIKQLQRVTRADFHLADPFLAGLEKGLHLLSKEALNRFVSLGLDKLKQNSKLAAKFLSLESKLGIDTFTDMQVTVPISQVQHQLTRYIRARTGLPISVRPLSLLSNSSITEHDERTYVCSDGKYIYLPDEISLFPHKNENTMLYKCLARLEAGHYEFNTFDFDLEKAAERCNQVFTSPLPSCLKKEDLGENDQKYLSDLERFFLSFPVKALASDLFTIFEHGRTRVMLTRQYPGLARKTLPVLRHEAARMIKQHKSNEAIFLLYLWIALGIPSEENFGMSRQIKKHAKMFADLFDNMIKEDQTVEVCAELVARTYPGMDKFLMRAAGDKRLEEFYRPIKTPFGRRLRPDLFFSTYRNYEHMAGNLKVKLEEKGFRVYKSEIKKSLIRNNGVISSDEIKEVILCSQKHCRSELLQHQKTDIDLSWLDLSKLLGAEDIAQFQIEDFSGPVSWYREWDCSLQDYLHAHVRVLDKSIANKEDDFYNLTLKRHKGMVKRIRYAFELLKPEGLVRLRQWVEGDEFDYRALLDFAMDKKAGKIPSDRLYISRSTSNTVYNTRATILDVEKEAIVLFCEALEVVGDAFAIAGFSGTGRLGVDYFRIKDFDEKMDDGIRQRINGMAPQRSTRMGAAIRHATSQLEKVSSKVRLLIIMGDGFPNDVDYKRDYAIEDTRKAIFEAHSKNIYTHAITVNFSGDSKLDDLYGNVHYNVISDVRELPDKLLRIYSGLTRH
jgi:hypothetical protein